MLLLKGRGLLGKETEDFVHSQRCHWKTGSAAWTRGRASTSAVAQATASSWSPLRASSCCKAKFVLPGVAVKISLVKLPSFLVGRKWVWLCTVLVEKRTNSSRFLGWILNQRKTKWAGTGCKEPCQSPVDSSLQRGFQVLTEFTNDHKVWSFFCFAHGSTDFL